MLLTEAMKHVNAILVISVVTWPILSNGHVTLQRSLSSIQVKEEAELLPRAHSYISSKTNSSSDSTNNKPGQTTKKSTENSPNIIPPTTDRTFDYDINPRNNNGSKVSYEFFVQRCNIQGTLLYCGDSTDAVLNSNLTEGCSEIFETSSFNFGSFPEDEYNRICNITEAVFNGLEAFSCLGGPLMFENLISKLETLEISNATENLLDILVKTKEKEIQFPLLKNLTFEDNNFSNQSKLNQIFAGTEVSYPEKNGTNATIHLFPKLERLQLSGSNVTDFNLSPFYMIPHIAVNNFPELRSVTVEGVTSKNRIFSLKTLSLANNPKLQTVSAWIMPSSPELKFLDLTSNPQLRVYPTSFFSKSLLDHVDLTNSSFICDCNIKKHDPKFFRQLVDQNCTTQDENSTLKTQAFLDSSICSTRLASSKNAKETNISIISTFVNSDIIVNCPVNPESGSILFRNDIDSKRSMPTHIAWITPMNDILVWIRQFVPSPVNEENSMIETMDNITVTDHNTTTMEQYDAIKSFVNDQIINRASQPWDNVIKSECVKQEKYTVLSRIVYFGNNFEGRIKVLPTNGSLLIQNMGWADRGEYRCLAWNNIQQVLNFLANEKADDKEKRYVRDVDPATDNINKKDNPSAPSQENAAQIYEERMVTLKMDTEYRERLYTLSLIYGFATAGVFLLLTLLGKFIFFVLHNYGCCLFCCCCKDQLPPKAKRLKKALDSIEAYKAQQLERLRENYHQQSDWIRQNCASQMERVRETYYSQSENIKGYRQYGSTQIQGVRDQYYDQMQRIRDYSSVQLERVNENYIFQRQKLRKFSAANYLKMREGKKYTQKTLNKVMENLPALYLEMSSCRQGMGDRQHSLEWEEGELEVLELGMDLPNEPSQLIEDPRNKAFIYNIKEDMKIQLNPQGASSKYRVSNIRKQDSKDGKGSGSLYFTPSSTPLRELSSSPTKGLNNHYSAVYQQDGDTNCSTLPNSSKTARNLSIKKMKPPLLKTHRKSRSFSFPFMPSYWFGTQNTNDGEDVSNVQGDNNDCDNSNQRVHKVLVERDACGSRDYLDVESAKEIQVNNGGTRVDTDCGKNNNADHDVEYNECDALLPESERKEVDRNHFISRQTSDQMNQGHLEDSPHIRNDHDHSLISSSTTNTSSSSSSNTHSNNDSSATGITNTETATSNSELFSNSTTGRSTNTTSTSDGLSSKRRSKSLEYEELLVDDNKSNNDETILENQLKSTNSEDNDITEQKLSQKRKSM